MFRVDRRGACKISAPLQSRWSGAGGQGGDRGAPSPGPGSLGRDAGGDDGAATRVGWPQERRGASRRRTPVVGSVGAEGRGRWIGGAYRGWSLWGWGSERSSFLLAPNSSATSEVSGATSSHDPLPPPDSRRTSSTGTSCIGMSSGLRLLPFSDPRLSRHPWATPVLDPGCLGLCGLIQQRLRDVGPGGYVSTPRNSEVGVSATGLLVVLGRHTGSVGGAHRVYPEALSPTQSPAVRVTTATVPSPGWTTTHPSCP